MKVNEEEENMKISEIHPIIYHLRIIQKRLFRTIQNRTTNNRFSRNYRKITYPHACKKHQSLLRRKLGNSDPQLQENKITNLKIAVSKIDGIIINPGEVFSFWKLVGKTTRNKGYIEGM